MRIVSLKAENVKRLRAVEITPTGDIVTISGRNGQGKSSVLDAIWFALGGKKAVEDTPELIRQGASKAEVTLDLGNITVRRNWTADNKTYLWVYAKDGRRYSNPQHVLDELVGRLSFNPLAFMQMGDKQQVATLLDLLKLPIDIAELDAERQKLYDQRTDVGRVEKQLEGQLAGMPEPLPDTPSEEISATDLLQQMNAALAITHANEEVMRDIATRTIQASEIADKIAEAENHLSALRQRLAYLNADLDLLTEKASILVDPDTKALAARIRSVESTNAAVRARQERAKVASRHAGAEASYKDLTQRIDEIDATKRKVIAEANMPVPGLGFDARGVTYNNLPLTQASSAEQLRVSMAMAMALNPQLRVIRIADGSLLDAGSLVIIATMAKDNDFQVWVEKVADAKDGTTGVYIEDGSVVE